MTSSTEALPIVRWHLRWGWATVLAFLALGLGLVTLHALKVPWYLDTQGETRRLMWTLAHAHGALLGVLNVVFAATVHVRPAAFARSRRSLASGCLVAATVLLPGGFLLGGLGTHDGDPGIGVLLVPVGGALLFAAVASVVRGVFERRPDDPGCL